MRPVHEFVLENRFQESRGVVGQKTISPTSSHLFHRFRPIGEEALAGQFRDRLPAVFETRPFNRGRRSRVFLAKGTRLVDETRPARRKKD